ncbi:MAG: LysR family transcriptional regulator [Synechococcales cyanobacterium K44_A2020_017]|nr:LysR family transcriptional regulator [Synechococcales cyanobacterium K32_A2020_035]MBF2094507.1 LysR family transcriptional regulator [Synechococcales cyanobacterium K44_A2020_017]
MRDNHRDSIKLSQLRALLEIANCGNFSEAALCLNVSQSAVSHAIATLENELGVVLLSRGRHGATLTPVGEQIIGDVRHVMDALEEIVRKSNLAKGLDGGQVRVASFRSVATHVLPAVIALFRKAFPAISVTIIEHQHLPSVHQSLRQGLADIGFLYLPAPDDFETWEILRDDYVALLPPDAKIAGPAITWDELHSFPLIMPAADDSCRLIVRKYFTQFDQPLTAAYEVREDSTIVSMVEQGLGATVIARLAAEPLPSSLRVYKLPHPLERVIGVGVLSEALHPPAVFAFLDVLRGTGKFSPLPLKEA